MKYIAILLIFISCNSEKRIIGVCADKFLIRDSVVYVDRYDTIYDYRQGDTMYLWDNKYIHDTTTIKSIKGIVKYKEKIVYRENVAMVKVLKDENEKNSITIIKLKEQLKLYKTIRNIIISIVVLSIFFSIYLKTISKKWL